MENDKRSSAKTPTLAPSNEQRKVIGQAIIDGLATPGSLTFINPLATEGGDYNQNGGPYTQSGGGNHDQGGDGGYNQSALTANLGGLDVTNLMDVLESIQQFRR